MALPPALESISAAFLVEASPSAYFAVRRECLESLRAQGFGPDSDGAAVESQLAGRRPLRELHCGSETFVLRAFIHGGLARWLTGERFRDPGRPFHELMLSERLRAAGVLTPEVVAARARRAPFGGWYLTLVTRRVEQAEDLGKRLARVRQGTLGPLELRPWIARTARAVRAMHDAGLWHADLNPHNLLLREGAQAREPQVWVLDLDRSELRPELDEAARRDNLRRLYRHAQRRDEHALARALPGRASITRTDCARFLRAYSVEPGAWKARFAAIAALHERGAVAHRAGWALERVFRR